MRGPRSPVRPLAVRALQVDISQERMDFTRKLSSATRTDHAHYGIALARSVGFPSDVVDAASRYASRPPAGVPHGRQQVCLMAASRCASWPPAGVPHGRQQVCLTAASRYASWQPAGVPHGSQQVCLTAASRCATRQPACGVWPIPHFFFFFFFFFFVFFFFFFFSSCVNMDASMCWRVQLVAAEAWESCAGIVPASMSSRCAQEGWRARNLQLEGEHKCGIHCLTLPAGPLLVYSTPTPRGPARCMGVDNGSASHLTLHGLLNSCAPKATWCRAQGYLVQGCLVQGAC